MAAKTRNANSSPNIIGTVFYANADGFDPEHLENGGFTPNGMYIRINNVDGNIAYISAFNIGNKLNIIDEMSKNKATTAALKTLEDSINNTKATKVDLEALRGEVNTKVSSVDIDGLNEAIATKAEASAIEEVNATIEEVNEELDAKIEENSTEINLLNEAIATKAEASAIEELTTAVNEKLNSSELESVLTDIEALKASVEQLTDISDSENIVAIQNQLALLNTKIQSCLTIDSIEITTINTNISDINSGIEELEERIDSLDTEIDNKASIVYVDTEISRIDGVLTNVSSSLDTKADSTDVANKANQDDLLTLQANINTVTASVNTLNQTIESTAEGLTTLINTKADSTALESEIASINASLETKADAEDIAEDIAGFDERIATIENSLESKAKEYANDAIDEFECEINNTISELRSSLNSQSRQITTQGTNITKLQEDTQYQTEKLKQSWVRVLSTNEYKKLLSNPPEGVFNNRYKYPNTVYMVVDFNKPKAIYIGDILIAKAEQSGSVGFAYTFPIIFN